ncbi:MAG: hypothetical protein ACD_19C00432G0005 [uncultured bacterium]|nr:MAG: hypothetical protein ACD_19C00432G0005 [uncultured bacterium]
MFTNIKAIDEYLELIGGNSDNIVAIWEQGSFLEGLNDEFSDRDFAIIWEDTIPLAEQRLKIAQKLEFDVHEIKDVVSIGQSFDMFSNGENLFNIGHGTKDKEPKWYEALQSEKLPSDLEEILMSISALDGAKIYYQKDNWVDKLKEKIKLTLEIKTKIINHYSKKASVDLKLINKSTSRGDLLQFLKYLEKVIRYLQLIYLIKEEKPVVSPKHFEKRFAKIENGEITKLIKKITSQIDMTEIFKDTSAVASSFGIEESRKYKA